MNRSIWKNPFIDNVFLRRPIKVKKKITIWSRRSTILPFLINKSIDIHNGRKFINLSVSKEMIGHKFGEFAPTRSVYHFKGKKK